MTFFTINGREGFIDTKLPEQIDKSVISDLLKKDKDAVFVVDGPERSGKSTFTINSLGGYIASKLGTPYTYDNICMTPNEFRNKVMECPKKSVIIYDEAHRGMASARSLSEVNTMLKDLMMEMGQKNLCVILVLPTMFLLDKYAVLFRTKGLFHIYERRRRRGNWVYFNAKNKFKLYTYGKKEFNYGCIRWPRTRGRFSDKWVIDQDEYLKKKANSFKEKERITKAEVYLEQRNKLLYALHKELKLSVRKLEDLCEKYGVVQLKKSVIQEIVGRFVVKQDISSVSSSSIIYNNTLEHEVNEELVDDEEIDDINNQEQVVTKIEQEIE